MKRTTSLRPASPNDFDFAFRVYCETMKDYSAKYIVWDSQKQRMTLAEQFAQADVFLIVCSRTKVGWIALQETDSSCVLGHFYIESQYQKRGIGSKILRLILAKAAGSSKPVELTVLKNNPARRLYERFGFVVENQDEMKYFMRRPHGI